MENYRPDPNRNQNGNQNGANPNPAPNQNIPQSTGPVVYQNGNPVGNPPASESPVQAANPSASQSAAQSAMHVTQTAEQVIQTAAGNGGGQLGADSNGGDGSGSNPSDAFVGLPIESLICGPIVAAAKGQQELSAVYIDTLMKLAYDSQSGSNGTEDGNKTKTLDFVLDRPVIDSNGQMSTQSVKISAPLLSLVPIPAFTMSELTVDFNMEVKSSTMSSDQTQSDVQSTVGFNSWFGLKSSITGNVSSDIQHKRETDSSATYTIHARAVQQPPTEGMQKLTSLFTNLMEPIDASKSSQ